MESEVSIDFKPTEREKLYARCLVLAERERCAKIIEEWADENWDNGMRSCWETDTAKEIAAAIRSGK